MFDPELWELLADSFGRILLPGLTMTIPLTAISFSLAMVIAIAVALVQFAHIRVLRQIARFYVAVCGVLRPSQRGNSHRSFSGSGAGLFSQ